MARRPLRTTQAASFTHTTHTENGERFYTDESTFIVMDTLKEDLLRRFMHDPAANQAKAKAAVASQVQIKQSPRWTKRFGQRVQDVFVF